ncbi:MAG: SHOCT domain-containing protein [Candidatus Methanomethylophilaceae archaeon]|nr:SHOCT domain-containing protein [Candidatus Methanomethylophilaceae archaeon]
MAKECIVCGTQIRFIGTRIKDGELCVGCRGRLPLTVYQRKEEYDGERIRRIFEYFDERDAKDAQKGFLGIGGKKGPTEEERIESLRRYKELLDDGIITQEEFDAKKKQLLEL